MPKRQDKPQWAIIGGGENFVSLLIDGYGRLDVYFPYNTGYYTLFDTLIPKAVDDVLRWRANESLAKSRKPHKSP